MGGQEKDLVVRDAVASSRWTEESSNTLEWLARLLRDEGTDLTKVTSSELARGSPVYAEAGADLRLIQRLMAQNHIRRLPVLEDGRLLGIVDLMDLALRESIGSED